MTLTPAQSWALILILLFGTIGFLYLSSRPTWTDRRRRRPHTQQLDELARLERARAALHRQYDLNDHHVRLSHPPKDTP